MGVNERFGSTPDGKESNPSFFKQQQGFGKSGRRESGI
jgi:hypothetical protein